MKLLNINRINVCAFALGSLFAISIAAHGAPAKIEICAACHGEDGLGAGFDEVPIIAGTPASHLEEALYAYKDGARQCLGLPAMCAIAALLEDAEIMELAQHYGAMRRVSSGEAHDATLAQAGERLHRAHCARCHVLPEDDDVEHAIGIPLHGQRSTYLRNALEAYLTGARETLVPKMAHELAELDADDMEAIIHYYASYRSP